MKMKEEEIVYGEINYERILMLHLNRILAKMDIFRENIEENFMNIFSQVYSLYAIFPYFSHEERKNIANLKQKFFSQIQKEKYEECFNIIIEILELIIQKMKEKGILLQEIEEVVI